MVQARLGYERVPMLVAVAVMVPALMLMSGCGSPAHGDYADGIVTENRSIRIGGNNYTYFIEEDVYPDILQPGDRVEIRYIDLNQDGRITEADDLVGIVGLEISDAEYEERMRNAQ